MLNNSGASVEEDASMCFVQLAFCSSTSDAAVVHIQPVAYIKEFARSLEIYDHSIFVHFASVCKVCS